VTEKYVVGKTKVEEGFSSTAYGKEIAGAFAGSNTYIATFVHQTWKTVEQYSMAAAGQVAGEDGTEKVPAAANNVADQNYVAAKIEQYSMFKSEREVLFPAYTPLRVNAKCPITIGGKEKTLILTESAGTAGTLPEKIEDLIAAGRFEEVEKMAEKYAQMVRDTTVPKGYPITAAEMNPLAMSVMAFGATASCFPSGFNVLTDMAKVLMEKTEHGTTKAASASVPGEVSASDATDTAKSSPTDQDYNSKLQSLKNVAKTLALPENGGAGMGVSEETVTACQKVLGKEVTDDVLPAAVTKMDTTKPSIFHLKQKSSDSQNSSDCSCCCIVVIVIVALIVLLGVGALVVFLCWGGKMGDGGAEEGEFSHTSEASDSNQ
jgi:hypothetical protein